MAKYNSLVSPSTKDVREHPELAQYEQAAANPQIGTTWFYAEPSAQGSFTTDKYGNTAGGGAASGSGTDVLNPGGTVDRDLARSLNMYGVNGSAAQSSFAGNPSNPQVGTTWIQTDTASQNGAGGGSQSSFGSGSAAGSSSSAAAPGSYAPNLQQSYMGAQYTATTPGQFEYAPAPVFNDPYQQALADANSAYYNKISTPFSYQKPADFVDPYRSTADSMLSQITNRQPFSYDYENDPVWQAYKKQYTREGRRASEDTMAQAAAMTGGIPSSYAVTAGAQAGNYYASQLSDKLPELYQMAYNRYLQEYQDKLNALNAVNNQTKIAQGVWEGNTNNAWKGIGQDFDIYTTDIQNAYNNANLQRNLSNDAFSRYQTDLNQYNTNRNFDYGNYIDQINYERDAEQTAYDRAKYLEDPGWKRDWDVQNRADERADIEYERQRQAMQDAIEIALKTGDTSALEALGVDPTYIRALLDAQLADQYAQTAARTAKGSGSSGSRSSGSKSGGYAYTDDGMPVVNNLTDEENAAADAIYTKAIERVGGGVSPEDWEYLNSLGYDDDMLESIDLWKMTEDEAEQREEMENIEDLGRAADKIYEESINTPPAMIKAVPQTAARASMPVSGDQAAAIGAQNAATGKSSLIYGKSMGGSRNAPAAGTTSTTATVEANPLDLTFTSQEEALKYALSHGVSPYEAKYYTEAEFNKYKNNNSDRSLSQYRTYRDYLTGYTAYLLDNRRR